MRWQSGAFQQIRGENPKDCTAGNSGDGVPSHSNVIQLGKITSFTVVTRTAVRCSLWLCQVSIL